MTWVGASSVVLSGAQNVKWMILKMQSLKPFIIQVSVSHQLGFPSKYLHLLTTGMGRGNLIYFACDIPANLCQTDSQMARQGTNALPFLSVLQEHGLQRLPTGARKHLQQQMTTPHRSRSFTGSSLVRSKTTSKSMS